MRRLKLIILICCSFKLGFSQGYETIVDTTKQWSVVNYSLNWEVPYEKYAAYTNGYRFKGDTLIDGFHYRFLEESNDSAFKNWYRSAYLCRDDSAGKVYIHNYEFEQILYDYTVVAGETIIPNAIDEPEVWIQVDSVKTEFLFGKERKIIYSGLWPISIQGFGNYRGPLGILTTHMTGNFSIEVLCFHQNNEIIYQQNNTCYESFNNIPNKVNILTGKFSVYPNPANEFINIESFDQMPLGIINIWSLDGKVFYHLDSPDYKKVVSINSIKSGIYILQIVNNNRVNITQKLIIQKN